MDLTVCKWFAFLWCKLWLEHCNFAPAIHPSIIGFQTFHFGNQRITDMFCVHTKRRDQFYWTLQRLRCQLEWGPVHTLLHLCPEDNNIHTFSFSHTQLLHTDTSDNTHLDKVHIHSVKLQPLAFVEKRNLCVRWTLSPEDLKEDTNKIYITASASPRLATKEN